ncbi:MAG: microcystin-dependent protein [Mariniblastus sp.]|jgi:microcystin-dependent protein
MRTKTSNQTLLFSALLAILLIAPISNAQAQENYRFIGEIALFGGEFVPTGWVACDGKTLSVSSHRMLHGVIGDTYGGDGVTTFNVPDLRNAEAKLRASTGVRAAKNLRYAMCFDGIYPSRDQRGSSMCEGGQVTLFAGSYAPSGWKIAGAKAAEKALHTSANLIDKGDNLRYIESLPWAPLGEDRSKELQTELYLLERNYYFVGEIRLTTAKTLIPTNWYLCEGQLLEVSKEPRLFSLFGKMYGGDGRVNFCLPDLSKIQSISKMNYYIVKVGRYISPNNN